MERLMQYVWQHRLWPPGRMATVDGRHIQIIDPGRLNTDAGPDFFNAKIQIDGRLWAGDVEIHVRASDWHRHGHDGDSAYDSVILHVVDRDDTPIRRSDGEVIPQMLMPCSPTLNQDYSALVDRADIDLPCAGAIAAMPSIYISDWLSALTRERLALKSDRIDNIRRLNSGSSEEAAYVTIARCLGFGTNGDPFERLARSLPLSFIAKHRDSLISIEALLFGQSGLLNPYIASDGPIADPYVKQLVGEYRFLAAKFGLRPLQSPGWKMARMRPANFPHRRVAYLAMLLHTSWNLHSSLLECADSEQAAEFFDIQLTGYWASHFHFTPVEASAGSAGLSRASINTLIINAVAPVIFNHGMAVGDDRCLLRAHEILESLPAESNSIVSLFGRAGIVARDAADSQAIVQLRREYCEARKCLYCRLGHRILSDCACRAKS